MQFEKVLSGEDRVPSDPSVFWRKVWGERGDREVEG